MVPLSVQQIEAATLTAWPSLLTAYDGLWLWRYARGYTKRANSIQCLDPADGGHAELRLLRLSELSERHGIPAIFRVTPLTAPEILDVLDGRFWDEFDHSLVMAMELPDADFPVEAPMQFFDPADPTWCKAQCSMAGNGEAMDTLRVIVESIPCEARGILVYHKAGLPVAAGMAVVSGNIGVHLNVVTHPSARGMGYGRAAMGAALNWVRSVGATYSALQVQAGNQPAINLYASLGFGEVYSYHYRRPHQWVEG
jgi:GNAT superfamily N-acetyltransferase